jgi:chromosome segregation ATPase
MSTDPKSLLDQRLADLHEAVRHRQKDWAAALAVASDSQASLADALRRERAERVALEQQLARQQAQHDIDIARAAAVRAMVEEQFHEAAREVERARLAETAAAIVVEQLTRAEAEAVARLAERDEEFATERSTITATRDGLEQQLSDAEAALGSARTRHAAAAAEIERLTRREAELASALVASNEQLSREQNVSAGRLATYQQRLEEEIAARRSVEDTLASELSSVMARRDSLEQQLRSLEARFTQESESRADLEQSLSDLRSTAAAAERRFRGQIDAITESARAEQAGLEEQMSRERQDYALQLAVEQDQHRSAITAAAARLAEREEQFKTELSSITATRDGLVRHVRDVQTRLADEQQQHRSAVTVAATQLAEREAQFKADLAAIADSRDSLEEQLRGVEGRLTQEAESRAALEQALSDLRSAGVAAEQRFRGEIDAVIESARAEQARLEDQRSREQHHFESQLTHEQEQHRSALAVAATRLAEREAQFKAELAAIAGSRESLEQQLRGVEGTLSQETEARTALEQALAELRSAAVAAEQRFRGEVDAVAESARTEQARLADQLSREQYHFESLLTHEQEQHRSALAVAATRLAEREAQFKAELASMAASRASLEQQLRDVERRLTQEAESRTALEQALTDLRSTAAAAEERLRGEVDAITEIARTERARLEDQLTQERAQSAARLAERGAEFEAELKTLSGLHASALARFQASIAERDSRLEERGRTSAALRGQLDASENENRRQFEEMPVPLIRCTRDLGVAGVNRAYAALVGYREHGELRDQSVVALFESREDLLWLIERSVSSEKIESVETTCLRKDGARVAVRLSACPSASGLIEIAVEDLTVVRVLEDKLREAHRMEAVGRLSSEIAVTCEKLLRDVYRDAQRLLTMMTSSDAQHPSDTLLEDVTRVSSFLNRLVAYGHEQEAALAKVDLNRILRDLEPVLRQVAGDAVALDLKKAASPVNVDVTAERVERLLVNVASYGRERMPHGGRLRIELSTVVVDGKFIAQHPDVRQGLHALITVTEVANAAPQRSILEHVNEPDTPPASERPGVDLGALQELISECGGHLWITAEPGGSMVVKMRLPLRAAWKSQADKQARHGLGRMTARLLGR